MTPLRFQIIEHQYRWPPRYNWNIVESGVKHYSTNPNTGNWIHLSVFLYNLSLVGCAGQFVGEYFAENGINFIHKRGGWERANCLLSQTTVN